MGVYVFGEPGMLLVKVGVSYTLHNGEREKALGRYWRGGEMLYWHNRSTGLDERAAHRILRSRFWLEGEWFVCGADVAISAIRRAVSVNWRKRKVAWSNSVAKQRRKRRRLQP